MLRSLLAASLLAAAAPAPAPAPASIAPVVEAERAFARMAQEKGTADAFRSFVAEDGQMFLPGPTRARPILDAGKIPFGPIRWWPVYAGIAASGDLGFTTGPAVSGEGAEARHGIFFTVWKRQPGGRWRWIMDKGSAQRIASPQVEGSVVEALPTAPRRAGAGAWAEVSAAEAALARALAADARAALAAALAPDGRLLRNGPPPAIGRRAALELLAGEPARIAAALLGGEASAAGDLAYTYGTAAWADASGQRSGYYVRIWQRRADGWRLVVDQTAAPPPPPRKPEGS